MKTKISNKSVAQNRFDKLFKTTIKATEKNSKIDTNKFTKELKEIGDTFEKESQKEKMNKNARQLAERLVSLKNNKFAGIIYSYLIKFNKGNQKIVEEYATNALIIAKRQRDPVHIMARTNDLRDIYKITQPNSDKYLSVLFDEKRALNDIINNYESAQKRYISTHREIKPIENYIEKLAAIKLEIGEVLLNKKEKHQAQIELQEAFEIYQRIGKGKNSEKIEKLLDTLK